MNIHSFQPTPTAGPSAFSGAHSQRGEHPMSYEAISRVLAHATTIGEVNELLSWIGEMAAHAQSFNDRALELDAVELRFNAECRLEDMTRERANA